MKILRASFASSADFLEHIELGPGPTPVGGRGLRLLLHTRVPLAANEGVLCELDFPPLPGRILVRATVREHLADPARAWLELSDEDRSTLDFAVAVARKEVKADVRSLRNHLRFPVEIPVEWQLDGSGVRYLATTQDLSAGGLSITTATPPPVGAGIVLKIATVKVGDLLVRGKVAWVKSGHDMAVGIRFVRAPDERKELRGILRRVLECGEVVLSPKPDAPGEKHGSGCKHTPPGKHAPGGKRAPGGKPSAKK